VTDATTGNIVDSLQIGNTRVRICDDYCRARTPDEIRCILDRIARRAFEALSAAPVHSRYEET